MKHMTLDIRNRIEFLVGCGFAVPKVAKDIGRAPSTVRNEILNHRVKSDKNYGCSNRLCARFDECARTTFDGFGDRRRKCQPKCFKTCPDFRKASCPRLSRPPFVCNGCEKERGCPLRKRFYIASVAQTEYESERSLSRTGVHPDEDTIARMNEALSPCLKNGQSPLALSHPNSYPRESLGWRTPYDVFVEKHGAEGKAFLTELGIVRIPANQVTLHPFLLGEKYQKAADKAILKKNGVKHAPKAEPQK